MEPLVFGLGGYKNPRIWGGPLYVGLLAKFWI